MSVDRGTAYVFALDMTWQDWQHICDVGTGLPQENTVPGLINFCSVTSDNLYLYKNYNKILETKLATLFKQ